MSQLVVTSPFGMRLHPTLGVWKMHDGVDLRAATGDPVTAAMGGVVTTSNTSAGGLGVHVRDATGHRWSYLHLSRIRVSPGQVVQAGQLIGDAGMTGRSTAPHLHFALQDRTGRFLDPLLAYAPGVFVRKS